MLRFITALLLTFSLAAPAWALETAHLRYHTLTRHWSSFEELAPEARNLVKLTVRVDAPRAAGPVAMWMEVGGRRYDLAVDSYGLIQVPRTADIIAADPLVESNQPRGSIETELALLLVLPDSQHFHYADLQAATDQTNALIRQAAGGLVSMFLPTVTGVSFTCPTGVDCAITIHRAAGDEILHADKDGKILLPLNSSLRSENPVIEASVPLSDVEPSSD